MKNRAELKATPSFKKYCYEYRWAFVGVFLIALLSYMYYMNNYSLSMDDEIFFFSANRELPKRSIFSTLYDGRLAFFIVAVLSRTEIPIPFWNACASVIVLYLACIVVGYSHWKQGETAQWKFILASSIFLTFTSHLYFMVFSSMAFSVSLAYVWTFLSASLVDNWVRKKKFSLKFFIPAVLLCFLGISTYTSFLDVFLVAACILCVPYFFNHSSVTSPDGETALGIKAAFIALFKYTAVLAGGVVLYFLSVLSLPSRGYVTSYINWGRASAGDVFAGLWESFKSLLCGEMVFHGEFLLVSIVIAAFAIIVRIIKNRRVDGACLLIVGLVVFSFMVPIALGNFLPVRSMQALPVLIMGCWYLIFANLPEKIPFLKYVAIAMCAYIIMYQSQGISKLTYTYILHGEHDKAFVQDINTRVGLVTGNSNGTDPIYILGGNAMPTDGVVRISAGTINLALSSANEKEPNRMRRLFYHYGYDYLLPTKEQSINAFIHSLDMPCWPATESVQLHDGVVVAKISNSYYTDALLEANQEENRIRRPSFGEEDTTAAKSMPATSTATVTNYYEKDALRINGWAFDVTKQPLEKLYIRIGKEYYYSVKDIQVEGLSDIYGTRDVTNTGFDCWVSIEDIPEGEHPIVLVGLGSDERTIYEYDTGQFVHKAIDLVEVLDVGMGWALALDNEPLPVGSIPASFFNTPVEQMTSMLGVMDELIETKTYENREAIYLTGWVAGSDTMQPLSNLYMRIGDNFYTCMTGLDRPDVSNYLEVDSTSAFGFYCAVELSYLPRDTNVIEWYGVGPDEDLYYFKSDLFTDGMYFW